jgi:putative pyruvate formate lyase activating enzyme
LGLLLSAEEIAQRAVKALQTGARTVMILGGEPTIHLPAALEIVVRLPDSARLVWKTNGRSSAEARVLLDGLFDVWLVDYKFGNPDCAARLVGIPDYAVAVQETLFWAAAHSELIVRHLAMPGHVECCWRPVAAWLAEHLPGTKVNLRTGFWPARLTRKFTELDRTLSGEETRRARQIAGDLGLRLIQ